MWLGFFFGLYKKDIRIVEVIILVKMNRERIFFFLINFKFNNKISGYII